jgi:8-oxo-dGTP diphosphatase
MPVPRRVADIDWAVWRPRDPATLVFVVREGHVLLIRKKRGLGAGKINGPGGKLEPGESPLEGALREVREEVGVTPEGVRLCGENSFQFVDGYSIHVHVFSATGCEGEPVETDEAVPLWAPVERIPFEEMWEDDRLWIPLVLEGRRFSGRFVFDGDAMLDYALDVPPL